MAADKQRVWLITGASSGFGRAIAEAALAAGDTVVAAARRPEADELRDLMDLHFFGPAALTRALLPDNAKAELAVWERVGRATTFGD